MYSNETLAERIKQGETALIPILWEQVRRLLHQRACYYYWKYPDDCTRSGLTLEDLKQESFFVLMDAVKYYSPEKGYKLNTYFGYVAQNRYNALLGFRRSAIRSDLLRRCDSLDREIETEDSSGDTIGDFVEDTEAQLPFEQLLEQVQQGEFHKALGEVMKECLTPFQEQVLTGQYFEGKTLAQLSEETGKALSWIRVQRNNAIRTLSKPQNARKLAPFYTVEYLAYHGGFQAFKRRQASSTELAAEIRTGL